jgi:hypothetical protein
VGCSARGAEDMRTKWDLEVPRLLSLVGSGGYQCWKVYCSLWRWAAFLQSMPCDSVHRIAGVTLLTEIEPGAAAVARASKRPMELRSDLIIVGGLARQGNQSEEKQGSSTSPTIQRLRLRPRSTRKKGAAPPCRPSTLRHPE